MLIYCNWFYNNPTPHKKKKIRSSVEWKIVPCECEEEDGSCLRRVEQNWVERLRRWDWELRVKLRSSSKQSLSFTNGEEHPWSSPFLFSISTQLKCCNSQTYLRPYVFFYFFLDSVSLHVTVKLTNPSNSLTFNWTTNSSQKF